MMICWHCGTEMIWGGDEDFESMDGGGIVSNFSCPNCPTTAEVYLTIPEEDKTEDKK
jgi:hypothetical protein